MRCSLIIPAYNAEKTIAACLESTLNQSLSRKDYDVIVVDDGSTDKTSEIVMNYPVRLVKQQNQGPAAARNRGANEAKGDILIFTDSDCELDVNFLEKIITPIEKDPEIVGIQGSYKTKQKEFIAQFGQVEIETRYRKMRRNKYIDFIGTYAAAYKRNVFKKYGGFDTGFSQASGEDTEFSYKLYQKGHKLVFKPEAFVYHLHPIHIRHYLKSKFYRGYWRVKLYKKHPKKAIRDSYTPQSLKFQLLIIPLFLFFTILSVVNIYYLLLSLLICVFFLFFSIPFSKLFKEKNYSKCVLIPFVLFLRALFLLLGMSFGIANELLGWNRKPLRR